MNRYWGLECNNHASHGVCSNNVDSAHTAGTGAMTGDINLYFGSYHQYRECPDDQATCFHGPEHRAPRGVGQRLQLRHLALAVLQPLKATWYGGDLSDSAWVHQVSTPYFTVAGSCDGASVTVSEYIKENDPVCCDDPMGTLWVSVPVANGSGNSSAQASVQNCNGGSQSGVYPYCGTFGATIWVAYICSTYSPPQCPDPQAEQDCYAMGWNWQPWPDCSCVDPCTPPPDCPYWNFHTCTVRVHQLNCPNPPAGADSGRGFGLRLLAELLLDVPETLLKARYQTAAMRAEDGLDVRAREVLPVAVEKHALLRRLFEVENDRCEDERVRRRQSRLLLERRGSSNRFSV